MIAEKLQGVFFHQQADRPRSEGIVFTYPYDLGWKENIKQVLAVILFSMLATEVQVIICACN